MSIIVFQEFVGVLSILAVKGSTVQLVCPFKHTGVGTLDWSFKSNTTSKYTQYTAGKDVVSYLPDEIKQRLNVTGNHAIGEYHLKISDIRESDQGTYECLKTGEKNTQNIIVIGKFVIVLRNNYYDVITYINK